MAQYLAQEHLNSEGEPDKKAVSSNRVTLKRRPRKKARLDTNLHDDADSSADSDFTSGSSDSGSSNGSVASANDVPLTNAEVSRMCFSIYYS